MNVPSIVLEALLWVAGKSAIASGLVAKADRERLKPVTALAQARVINANGRSHFREPDMLKGLLLALLLSAGTTAAFADAKKDCNDKLSEAACTELIQSNSGDASAYRGRGLAYKAKGDDDRAIADYGKAIELDPKYTSAFISRGNAYLAKGDNDRAVTDYSKAIELDPKYAIAFNNRGLAYKAKGDNDRAIADYSKAIEFDPKYASAFNSRGNAYKAKGDDDRAIADYSKAIELDPKSASAFRNRGIAYKAKGDNDRAITDYAEAIRLDPKYALVYHNRGIVYQAKGDLDRAIADFRQALSLSPSLQASKDALKELALARDLATMSRDEVTSLQRRLTDAGCYKGAIDGTANPATEAAVKACPVMDPILSVETDMHTSIINRMGVDRECRLLATGSNDKTARLWSLPEGRLLRAFRPPIGPGEGGRVYAVALSPDGRLVAAGGWDARASSQPGHAVYLFDAATGALKARVGGFESVIFHLTFSPDGHFLAATLGGGKGLRVIDTERMSEVAADRDYGERSSGAAFAPDGRLFTVAWDGYFRAYDAGFRLVGKAQTRGGRRPDSVAVDPTGQQMTVGFDDSPAVAVEVYKTSDLSFAFAADITGAQDKWGLGAVAWSTDGQQLIAGGKYQKKGSDGVSRYPVFLWDRGGQGARQEQAVALNTIWHILPCGAGFAVGASGPLFALLDRDGKPRLSKSGVSVDMRSKRGEALQVSRDGRQVRFGLGGGKASPALFDVAGATLTKDGTAPGLAAAKIDGIAVTDWQDNTAPKLDGKELKLQQNDSSRSLAITPDGARFALGSDYSLRSFDAQGKQQWRKPVLGSAWGVNVTADGRLVLAAYGDGTIRWHRMSDGQELLALFVNKDDLRWVAWTPSGYYMASPGGEDMIGWQVNRGWDKAADFFPVSRFRDQFYRPDIVQAVLETLDESEGHRPGQRRRQAQA
ncbi:MAG: tetratricopeptide repeat protein [Xanthobacteraceae bacterium]